MNEERRHEFASYVSGLALAAILTAIPFAMTMLGIGGRRTILTTLAVLGVVQAAVHLRFFLHIDLSRQKREDLQLILFSTLLLGIMVSGTIWILSNLAIRMH